MGDGALYIGVLTWAYPPSLDPFGGSVDLMLSIRNEHTQELDGTATFWLTNIFGGPVGVPVTVAVPKFQPHESRAVAVAIHGIGQWTVLTAHATFTPPARISGPLSTVTRLTGVFAMPWAVVLSGGLGGGWFGYRRLMLQRMRPAAPAHPAKLEVDA